MCPKKLEDNGFWALQNEKTMADPNTTMLAEKGRDHTKQCIWEEIGLAMVISKQEPKSKTNALDFDYF